MPIFEAAEVHCFLFNYPEGTCPGKYEHEIIIIMWVNLMYFNYTVTVVSMM